MNNKYETSDGSVKSLLKDVDPEKFLQEGIKLFESTIPKLSERIDKANQLVNEIQQLCEKKGVTLPDLNQAVIDSNKLLRLKTKVDKYMGELNNENNPVEKKVAILSVMVELAEEINTGSN